MEARQYFEMNIHLVIPVKVGPEVPERLENLRNCLESAAAIPGVVVDVIDVHSDIDWKEFLPADPVAPLQVFRTPFSQWNKSTALNYAIEITDENDIIAVVDADHLLPRDLATTIQRHCRPGKFVFPLQYSLHEGCPPEIKLDDPDVESGSHGWWSLTSTGSVWGYVNDYRQVGCYSTELGACWGAEDTHFFAKARTTHSVSRIYVPGIYHQWHPHTWSYLTQYAEEPGSTESALEESSARPAYGWTELSAELSEEIQHLVTEECKEDIFNPVDPWKTSWAVGVTTASREIATLRDTLVDLVSAGWDTLTVFAEPGLIEFDFCAEDPALFGGVSCKVNKEVLGAWRNWRTSFISLVEDNPEADFYAIVQDDVTVWHGLRRFFDKRGVPNARAAYSPYTAGWYGSGVEHPSGSVITADMDWFLDPLVLHQLGALFTIIPQELAKELVEWLPEEVPNNKGIDPRLAEVLQNHSVPFYRHSPSLADHTGVTSTLGYDPGEFNRCASDFVGTCGDVPSELLDD